MLNILVRLLLVAIVIPGLGIVIPTIMMRSLKVPMGENNALTLTMLVFLLIGAIWLTVLLSLFSQIKSRRRSNE